MAKLKVALTALNRGEVSRLALARVDLDRLRLSAETQVNFMPRVLGPMSLRPGLKYLGNVRNHLQAHFIPFVFGNSDTAMLELTNLRMRVWVDDELVTRPFVGTTVTNGDFSSATGWHRSKLGTSFTAVISGGKLTLNTEARGAKATCWRFVNIPKRSRGVTHGLRITVDRGSVTFRAGTGELNDNIIETTTLGEGVHSLAFTPGDNIGGIYVHFESHALSDVIIDECRVETADDLDNDRVLLLTTPWVDNKLRFVRHAQSGDVVFVACQDVHPYKIERRGTASWSIVKYLPKTGPLQIAADADVRLKPGAMYGNTTLTSDIPYFTSDHVGVIFRLFTDGQENRIKLAGDDTWTDPVRITGVQGEHRRRFNVVWEAGTPRWIGTLTIQRSLEDGDLGVGFVDIPDDARQKSPNGQIEVRDQLDNSIVWYRAGFKDNNYRDGSGYAEIWFRDGNKGQRKMTDGGRAGYCRVTAYNNRKSVDIEILKEFSNDTSTKNWQKGAWNPIDGYPSAVEFHDGRIWWVGGDKIWGSASDDYENFDIAQEGDAATIQRSIGYGPIDTINWILPLTRMILGREGAETSVRSSAFDEPITPTSFTLKDCSTKGSARIPAIKCDTRGLFVSKSTQKLYELNYDVQANDYQAHDLTRLHPDIAGTNGFKRLCLQTHPDTTVHCVRADGQVAVLLYDKEDEVEAWWRVETDGEVEEAFVLPGTPEDSVYYVVKRTIGGATKRYLEKFALRSECTGLPEAKLADSFIIDTGGDRTISGLSHLEGELVVAWGWDDAGTTGVHIENPDRTDGRWLVTNGFILLPVGTSYDNVCVGLQYDAVFKSAKLAYGAQQGTALNQKKRIDHVGLILYDTHYQGLQYGQRSDVLDDLPLVSEGTDIAANTVHSEFDEAMIELPGEWDTDSRLYLKAQAPRPCTVAAAVIALETNE